MWETWMTWAGVASAVGTAIRFGPRLVRTVGTLLSANVVLPIRTAERDALKESNRLLLEEVDRLQGELSRHGRPASSASSPGSSART